jgi:hypothetical protein
MEIKENNIRGRLDQDGNSMLRKGRIGMRGMTSPRRRGFGNGSVKGGGGRRKWNCAVI